MSMIDIAIQKEQESLIRDLKCKLKILEELADEILLLQNPEPMREVALYIKEVIKQWNW